ncbi:glycoside hydrolase family 127 protein [Streptosporangium sp. G11]|uniref:glycoside hydrolase family 127 protein n=1 Tax=Streptosporangium sp. G11 TaxID=3436926 RepID=UPI003EB8F3BC
MANPVVPSSGVLTPLGLDAVRLDPGFWGDLRTLDQDVIIGHCLEWMDKLGWIGNFRGEPRRGREFSDSEAYKLLEAMAWAGDPRFDELAATVVAAQEPDGYLNTRWSGDRYRDFEWGHELYCAGHLIQAGVARWRTAGEHPLTDAVRLAADHVCRRFMEGHEVCGHPEIEMALVELYRLTGTERYLEMARRFVERRGRPALADIELGRAYFQDEVPVRRARGFGGHAVRAMYLACGAVDVAVETGDAELLAAIEAQWEHTVARRVHLTGGMGSRHTGESFGEDFELPPDRAYAETCAGIGSVMLAHRLLLATGRSRYADLAERTLYNLVAASPALDGRSFFYANPLQVRTPGRSTEDVSPRAQSALRAPWFWVSCCPTNLARTFASLPAYLATATPGGIQIHHPTACEISHDGLTVRVETRYPWSGAVSVRVVEAPADPRHISLRLPPWAAGALEARETPRGALNDTVSRHPDGLTPVRRGQALVFGERVWTPGEVIGIELPMEPRWVRPDPRVDAVRGCAAVERGPVVYCAESPGDEAVLAEVVVDPSRPPVERAADNALREGAAHGDPAQDGPLQDGSPQDGAAQDGSPQDGAAQDGAARNAPARDGAVQLEVRALRRPEGQTGPPHGEADDTPREEELTLRLVPYHRWGNHGPATMRVWLPTG